MASTIHAATARRRANFCSISSASMVSSRPAVVSSAMSRCSASILRLASASSSRRAMPAITVRRVSPISPKSPLNAATRPSKSAARSSRCCSCPSSQPMRYFLPAFSTTTSGIAKDLIDRIHGGDQPTRDFGRGVVQPLGLGAGLVVVAGELGPLGQQLLGIGFDAGVGPHPAVEAAHAGLQPLKGPVQPLGGGFEGVFDVTHWFARKSRDSANRHYRALSLTGKSNLLSQCPPRRRPGFPVLFPRRTLKDKSGFHDQFQDRRR